MNLKKLQPWIGVALALLPAVKLAGQILGFPILDISPLWDSIISASGGTGVALVAKSEPVGKK